MKLFFNRCCKNPCISPHLCTHFWTSSIWLGYYRHNVIDRKFVSSQTQYFSVALVHNGATWWILTGCSAVFICKIPKQITEKDFVKFWKLPFNKSWVSCVQCRFFMTNLRYLHYSGMDSRSSFALDSKISSFKQVTGGGEKHVLCIPF